MDNLNNTKQWFNSKRFWAGLIAIITLTSAVLTGEKSWEEQLPLLVADGFAFVQLIISLVSGKAVASGSRSLYKNKN